MRSAEPNPNFENALFFFQQTCGVLMLAFNGLIMILIMRDGDLRNRQYRKYLFCLQIPSLAYDVMSDFYSPIFLMHKGLGYADSPMANVLSVGGFMLIEAFLQIEVVVAYFACIFYRRSHLLDSGSLFTFHGWRRTALFIFLQLYGLFVFCGFTHFMRKSRDAAMLALPIEFEWVRNRTTYLFLIPDENFRHAASITYFSAWLIAITMFAMIGQMVVEIKKNSRKMSTPTRRFQQLAVRSILLQGAVPSIVYIVPSNIVTFLQFAPTICKTGEGFDNFANVLSPIMWIVGTLHTFVSSLTILYCSPSYRVKLIALLKRSQITSEFVVAPQTLSKTN